MRYPTQKILHFSILLALLGTSSGCSQMQMRLNETFNSDDPCANNARNIGMVIGAAGGAILGNVLGKGSSNQTLTTVLGAAAGTALGGLIGHDIDRRRCELHQVAQAHQMSLAMQKLNLVSEEGEKTVGMSAQLSAQEQFAPNSAMPTQKARQFYQAFARRYRVDLPDNASPEAKAAARKRQQNMRILFIGHTDDSGSSAFNADLSEKRAKAVAQIFAQTGFEQTQIFYQGAGETLPIADNRTQVGRSQNRRVEIVDLSDEAAFEAYLASRQPSTAFYRNPAEKNITQTVEKKRTSPQSAQPRAQSTRYFVDFGGTTDAPRQIDIGPIAPANSGFFIRQAQANTALVGSCTQDSYRVAHGVKSLSTQEIARFKTNDYLPGLYNTSWAGMVNGHLVALSNVGVLKDGASPTQHPTLLIYENYAGNKAARAQFKTQPNVNVYQGQKGILYRVFLENAPIECIDLVFNQGKTQAQSRLFYQKENTRYQAPYLPELARR